ncbi:MAG: M67 family metallopeptidase [Chloroflexi bacterium]|nr:M67 family metallopeptidase [Chloroflexota bacterium]
MTLRIPQALLARIGQHGQRAYPEEGAGLMLGRLDGEARVVTHLLPLENHFQPESRGRRYLITPRDLLRAEDEAEHLGLDVVGVFHSHPDHPARASEFDTQWALPVYSYLITRVQSARAFESTCWRLTEDRSRMDEEALEVTDPLPAEEAS